MRKNKQLNLVTLGPAFLLISILCLGIDDTPPEGKDDLTIISGTLINFESNHGYKGGTNESILVLSDGEVRTLKVFCNESSLKIGSEFVAKVDEGWRDIAWELEQDGELIYSFEEVSEPVRNRNAFIMPIVILMLVIGVVFTPIWLLGLMKKARPRP